jgi:hypothetical protein
MTTATRPSERIGLPPVQVRAEARIDEHVQLDAIRHEAAQHDCTALPLIDHLRVVYRAHTPAFTGEAPMPSSRLLERIQAQHDIPREPAKVSDLYPTPIRRTRWQQWTVEHQSGKDLGGGAA